MSRPHFGATITNSEGVEGKPRSVDGQENLYGFNLSHGRTGVAEFLTREARRREARSWSISPIKLAIIVPAMAALRYTRVSVANRLHQ
jgi:hypothetical protein